MSDDEVFTLLVAAVVSVAFAFWWYAPLFSVTMLGGSTIQRLILAALFPACLLLIALVVHRYGATEVRQDAGYLALFTCCGAAALAVVRGSLPLLGIAYRRDAIERHNLAAVICWVGALAGETLAYAGSNIGEGPTIWTTLGPAAATLSVYLVLCLIIAGASAVTDAVVIDRDVASSLRLSAAMVSMGVILGRSAAGDWVSSDAMLQDLVRFGWPALVVAGAAIFCQHWFGPAPRRWIGTVFQAGFLPSLLLLAIGVAAALCLR